MAQWLQGRVVENQHWTDTLFSLRLSVAAIEFVAGQFISLALDVEGERIARPYSLVNAPGSDDIECYLVLVPDGILSKKLMQLNPGDEVFVSQRASGFFTLDEVVGHHSLWLMASGTGIGPYLSMLTTDEPWQRFNRIHLLHSVSKQAQLAYSSLIENLQRQYPVQFNYRAIVTRENLAGTLGQRLPTLIDNGVLEQSLNDTFDSQSAVMLCGNPDMVADCLASLKQRGLQKNLRRKPGQVTVERYW
jgi:ferredoxin/flavodoxin---NADP+ reductase